jgi:hypothetical protein
MLPMQRDDSPRHCRRPQQLFLSALPVGTEAGPQKEVNVK